MTHAPRPLEEGAVLDLMRVSGALLEGHFLLTSGLHSPVYLQCARLLMEPARATRVAEALRAKLLARGLLDGLDVVLAPAMGGIILGYELARQAGLLSLFAERQEGRFTLRRGFALAPAAKVLIAEDIVTTGLSTRECIACAREAGGDVVAAACLVDRSGGKAEVGAPLVALATLELPTYPAGDLPPELSALPAVKPGSRSGVAS